MKSKSHNISQAYSDDLFATTEYTKRKTNFPVSSGNNSPIYKNSVCSVCSVVKKSSSIDNQSLRNLTGIDALPASSSLQKLKNLGFLEQKGQARATYYVATPKLMSTLPPELGPLQKKLGPLAPELGPLGAEVEPLESELGTLGSEVVSLAGKKVVSLEPEVVSLAGKKVVSLEPEVVSLPDELQKYIDGIGKRTPQEKIRLLVLELCKRRPLSSEQISKILKRHPKLFKQRYLNPMKKEGFLEYTIPDMINHPRQAYRITEKGKRKLNGGGGK